LQSRPLGSKALAPVVMGGVGLLSVCKRSSNSAIPADVIVQTQVSEELESPATTSFPSSVPLVETLLSRTDGQPTPLPAHVLVQTSVSEVGY